MTWGGSLALGLPALVGAPWVGPQFPNVYSPRLRFAVLNSGDKKLCQWVSQ